MFSSPLGIPRIEPPYGEMAVVDLTTQEIVPRRPVGTAAISLPGGRIGAPKWEHRFLLGSIVTAGGLINGGVMTAIFEHWIYSAARNCSRISARRIRRDANELRQPQNWQAIRLIDVAR